MTSRSHLRVPAPPSCLLEREARSPIKADALAVGRDLPAHGIRLEATIAATALSSRIVGKAFACLFDKPEFGLESPSVGEE
jgi:hypothetical protein